MILDFCVVCGSRDDVQQHHFIPRSAGGSNEETNKISLCRLHHMVLHQLETPAKHRRLVSSGIHRAKAKGTRLGPKPRPMAAFNSKLHRLAPEQRVLLMLYAIEQIAPEELATLRWADIVSDYVKTPFRQVFISEATRNMIAMSIKRLGLSGEGLMNSISATRKSPTGRTSAALSVWIGRQRNT